MTDVEITLSAHEPHRPEYTRQVAAALAEAVRILNYATMPSAFEEAASAGLAEPSDVDAVVQELAIMASRLPQLFGQLARWLGEQDSADRLEVSHGRFAGKPWRAVAEFKALMTTAEGEANPLCRALDAARQVTATIGAVYDPSENPDA
jgi:hypothetical protein